MYWLQIALNLGLGLLYAFYSVSMCKITIQKIHICDSISTINQSSDKSLDFFVPFTVVASVLSLLVLLDAYRRFYSCGRAELAVSLKKMVLQFSALLLIAATEMWIAWYYIVNINKNNEKFSVASSAISYFILI